MAKAHPAFRTIYAHSPAVYVPTVGDAQPFPYHWGMELTGSQILSRQLRVSDQTNEEESIWVDFLM